MHPRSAALRRAEPGRGRRAPLLMDLRYRIGVRAPLPTGVGAEIERRFGPVRITEGRGVTLRGTLMDQAALRGLLTLLWDLGADLVSVRVAPI